MAMYDHMDDYRPWNAWTQWEGSQAQAHIQDYGDETDSRNWGWGGRAPLPDTEFSANNESVFDSDLFRTEFADGSAVIATPAFWGPGVHRDYLEAANLVLAEGAEENSWPRSWRQEAWYAVPGSGVCDLPPEAVLVRVQAEYDEYDWPEPLLPTDETDDAEPATDRIPPPREEDTGKAGRGW